MPKLVRLYIVNVIIGFGIAAIFLAGLLALDVAGLGHLVMHTQGGWLAGVMILVFSGTIFAGVQFGIAVMGLAERDEPPQGGLRQHARMALQPVRVRVEADRNTTTPRRRH